MSTAPQLTLFLWLEGLYPRRIVYQLIMKGLVASAADLLRGETTDPSLKIVRMGVDTSGGSFGWTFEPASDPMPAGHSSPSLRVRDGGESGAAERWVHESASIADLLEDLFPGTPATRPAGPVDRAVAQDLVGVFNLACCDMGYYFRHASPLVAGFSGLRDGDRNRAAGLNAKATMLKNLKKVQAWSLLLEEGETRGGGGGRRWLTPGMEGGGGGPGVVDLAVASARRYFLLGYDFDLFEDEELAPMRDWYARFTQLPWWAEYEERDNVHPKEFCFGKDSWEF